MRDSTPVRTTLDIEDDVLQTAKELADARGMTAGQIVSELLRRALESPRKARARNGIPLLPARPRGAARATMRLVNELRDGD